MGAEVVLGSVTDRAAVQRSMKGVEYVFHLAAAFRELNVPNSFYDDVNVNGTRIVVEEAIRAGVWKFVYCSTCGVHGNVDHPPANEDAPIQPADYYQRTKYEAEPLVKQLTAGKMEMVILRPAAIYGPGDPGALLHDLQARRPRHLPDVRQRQDALPPALHRQPGGRVHALPGARASATVGST